MNEDIVHSYVSVEYLKTGRYAATTMQGARSGGIVKRIRILAADLIVHPSKRVR